MKIPEKKEDVDEEWFQEMLHDAGETDVVIEELSCEPGTNPGENFFGEIIRCKVKGTKRNIPWNASYIMKFIPQKQWLRKVVLKMKIFEREVEAYTMLLQDFNKVQSGPVKLAPDTPKCLFGGVKGKNGVVVLEDLKELGYKLSDPSRGQDLQHCILVMKSIAKFHALGYKFKYSSTDHVTQKYNFLKYFFFNESKEMLEDSTRNGIFSVCAMLQRFPERTSQRMNLMRNVEPLLKLGLSHNPTEPFSTICHGDCWNNNLMFRYSTSGEPIDVKMVDLQGVYYDVPTRELGYFFCMSTKGSLRRKHLKELLLCYHSHLLQCLDVLGVTQINQKNFPFVELLKMYYSQTICTGLVQSLAVVPLFYLRPEETVGLINIEGEDVNNIMEKYERSNRRHIFKVDDAVVRVCDLLDEIDEMADVGVI